ncbi:MAG: DUF697 domain-containing protein [Chloroflexota bacterium]
MSKLIIELTPESKTKNANRIVTRYSSGALAAGFVPVAILDIAILSGIQLKMIHSLANLYRVKFTDHLGKSLIAALIDSVIPTLLSLQVASLTKSIPGVGWLAGAGAMSLSGSAFTFAVGKVFIQHFASGGTLLDFEPQKMQEYFISNYQTIQAENPTSYEGIRP